MVDRYADFGAYLNNVWAAVVDHLFVPVALAFVVEPDAVVVTTADFQPSKPAAEELVVEPTMAPLFDFAKPKHSFGYCQHDWDRCDSEHVSDAASNWLEAIADA